MAINKNHEFEDLEGVKCAIVERNVNDQRLAFLKELLEYNGYTVIAVPVVPKVAPESTEPPPPATYTVGVTNVMFNPVNAIFGRLLKTPDGHTVSLAYWQQKENVSDDQTPYFNKG